MKVTDYVPMDREEDPHDRLWAAIARIHTDLNLLQGLYMEHLEDHIDASTSPR